jgi:hypothetical protein
LKQLSFYFLFFIFFHQTFYPQCCGGCSPIGGNTNQGTLPKYTLMVNTYYKYGYSAGYMEKDHSSDFKFVENANNSFVGMQVGYGITKRLTGQIEAGYYLNRTQNFDIYNYRYTLNGSGGSSLTFSGKYNIIKDTARDIEFTMGIGARVPWSTNPQVVGGVVLTDDVQPSNGAYGLTIQSFLFKEFDEAEVKIFLMNSVNINNENLKHYKEGNTYLTSLFISKTVKKITGIAQIRNEIRDYCYRDGKKVVSSGGYRFVFAPQLNYSIKQKYNISVLYELPIYQYYYGIQLNDRYAFSVNLNIRLGLSKKANQYCAKPN